MNNTNIIIYQTQDGQTKIETKLENETVWLSQEQMSELFQKSRSTINEHIKNIYRENELEESTSMKKFGNSEFAKKPTNYYNLDVIISVGYRVKSLQGTKFRQWATARLNEYIVKGFTMNDELLKNVGGGNYFKELLARIRDIRSSEKVFYRMVLDIYATSIDYDPKSDTSILFFKTIQNKMHWATHGHTASELIYQRVDSQKTDMGLTVFKGVHPTKEEVKIAKNYLDENELNILNRMVMAYLEIAELQALNQTPMYMKDWIERLDDFLKMTGKDILTNAGTVSHEKAIQKAKEEYDLYKLKIKDELSFVEKDFVNQLSKVTKKIEGKS
jgi:hypothetical protein